MPARASTAKPPGVADGTRSRLLEAAGEVFAECGFQAATVRGICARAGVNVALVNYYFGDKSELYGEVLRHSFGSTEQESKALEGDRPPAEAFRDVVHAMLRRTCRPGRPGWHFRLLVHEMAQPTPALSRMIEDTMRPIHSRLRALIGAMLGLSPEHDTTRLCTHSVIAQAVHYVAFREINKQIWPELELTPERIEQIAGHIADFSLAYLLAHPARQGAAGTEPSPGTIARNTARRKT